MCIAYRKADEMNRRRTNFNAWLQGAYVYEAISDLAPALKAFAKGRAKEYRRDVIPILESEKKEQEERRKKEQYEQNLARFKGMVRQINENILKQQEAETDGSGT